MKRIEDEAALRDAVRADRAMLFLHAVWSMESCVALHVVHEWDRDWLRPSEIISAGVFLAVYGGNADGYPPSVVRWLTRQGLVNLSCAGNGEVLWLQHGRVVDKVLSYRDITAADLTRRTMALWG